MQTISENLVSFIHFTCTFLILSLGFPGGSEVKVSACMQETQVRSLGREGPLEKEMATHSSILTWRIPMDRGAWWPYSPQGCKESHTTEPFRFSILSSKKSQAKLFNTFLQSSIHYL